MLNVFHGLTVVLMVYHAPIPLLNIFHALTVVLNVFHALTDVLNVYLSLVLNVYKAPAPQQPTYLEIMTSDSSVQSRSHPA